MNDSFEDKNLDDKNAAYDELKRLLLSEEQVSLEEIRHHLFDKKQRTKDLAEILPESITSASKEADRLSSSMSPVIHGSIRKLIKKDPQHFADALFPVMGPAIRKSINETLKSFMQSLNQVLEQNTSAQGLKWRFESWRTGIPYADLVLKHTLVYRVDEVFLIQPGSGLLIAHAAHPDVKSQDSDAVSAMLSAIQDFVRDSFAQDKQSGLDTVELGEHILWVITGPNAILACAIRGIAPISLRGSLQTLLEELHGEYEDQLESFEGDKTGLESVEDKLAVCLQAERATEINEEKKSFFSPPLLIILSAVLILIGIIIWQNRDYAHRLNEFKMALDAKPGVILYESTELDDRLQLKLLVDPLAEGIDALPAKYEFDSDDIELHKTAYQSLEPQIVLRRVKQILQVPETVSLVTEENNSLIISGVAPLAWIRKSQDMFRTISGFSSIDDSKLIPDYSAIERLAKQQLRIPEAIKTEFDGEYLSLFGQAPAEWMAWYAKQETSIEQVKGINDEQLYTDEKSLNEWLIQQYNIPASLNFSIKDKRLVFSGDAPYAWYKESGNFNYDNPWITTIDISQLTIIEEQEFLDIRGYINSSSVNFSDGIEVVIGTENKVLLLANKIKRLQVLLDQLGYEASIELIGRTDGLGTYKKNENLALKRADWVKQKLQQQGVLPTLLLSQAGLIELSDKMNIANRRVDFNVKINKTKTE